ncbi:MAG: LamG-like jellyroll fold domain-containing protein [Akkermansiaceae bacterium]
MKRFKLLSGTLFSALALFTSSTEAFSQTGPTIVDHYIIDDGETALAGLLEAGDRFGRDFNPMGDLDLDGVPDFVVGARSDDDGFTDAGAVYILFMNADGSVKSHSKISATSGGLTAAGVTLSAGQFFGYAVTSVGDLDGDSVQDLAVGARRGGATEDGGAIFITFLNRDGSVKAVQPITNTEGTLGLPLISSDFFGEAATSLGVIDGVPTLAVSNAFDDDGGNNRGAIYILSLNADGTAIPTKTVKISSTSGGFGTGLTNGDQFGGRDIALLGDIDGDMNLDIAVGAFSSNDGRGAVWVLRLNADFTVKAKQKIGQGVGGLQATLEIDDNFGHTVTSPGDIDGDGIPDLITSANKSDVGDTDLGELYYIYLNSDGTVKQEIRANDLTGTLPFALPSLGRFGRVVSVLGDLANDGTICLAVGGGAGSTGIIYLLFLEPEATPLLSSPTAITGNVLWLDASDPDGDFITGGTFSNDDTWVDKSSLKNANATQAVANIRPTLIADAHCGLSVVEFDGNDYMDVASAAFGMLKNKTGATVFAVARPTEVPSMGGGHRVFMASTGTNSDSTRAGFSFYDSFGTGLSGTGDAGLNGRRLDTDGYQRISGGDASLDRLTHWTGIFNYAHSSLELYADGGLVSSASNFQTDGNTENTDSLNIRLGADASLTQLRGFFKGDLAELIIYDRVLTAPERQKIEQWLDAKWSAPVIDLDITGGNIEASWPVTPVEWTLETSVDLIDFIPATTTNQIGNQIIFTEPLTLEKKFFRLVR